jgi:hypothetical protein
MYRSYEEKKKLNTKDLLTAIKYTCNYEGDLYYNNSLVISCLGLSREENTKNLIKYGIETFVKNGYYNYKYKDKSKNSNKIYASFYAYNWDGVNKLDVKIHDYILDDEKHRKYNSIDEAIKDIKIKDITIFGADNIHITSFLNNECESLQNKLFYECKDNCYLGEFFKNDCKCKNCNSLKKTSKGCTCQSVQGCYKK